MKLIEVDINKEWKEWDSFVEKGSHSHVYQYSGMAKVMETLGYSARFFAFEDSGGRKAQIVMLQKVILTSASIKDLISAPIKDLMHSWFSYSPPVLHESTLNKNEETIFKEFIEKLQEKAKAENVGWITIWSNPLWDSKDWFNQKGFKEREKQNAILKLGKTKEETWNSLYKHARRDVRKGKETEAFTRKAKSIEEMKEFYSIYESHHNYLGIEPYPWGYFEFFWEKLVEKKRGLLLVVELEGKIVAGMMLGLVGNYIYEFTNSVKPEAYNCFPTDLMNWWLVEWAVPLGYEYFDLSNVAVGKMNPKEGAIRRFKKKWGKIMPYHEFKWFSSKKAEMANYTYKLVSGVWEKSRGK